MARTFWQLLRKGQTGIMLSEQDNLPKLPVNSLTDAIEDFLRATEPLLSPDEFAQTKQCAQEFLAREGPVLHKMLVEYDEEESRNSYLEVPPLPSSRMCFCCCQGMQGERWMNCTCPSLAQPRPALSVPVPLRPALESIRQFGLHLLAGHAG